MAPFSKDDIKEMKNMYIDEGSEKLASLEKQLQLLERDNQDSAALVELYRIMHSFKGMAATIGLNEFEKVFHATETLISKIQEKKVALNKDLIDFFYEQLEFVEYGINLLKEDKNIDPNKVKSILEKIEVLKTGGNTSELEIQKTSRMKELFEEHGLEEYKPEALDFSDEDKKFYLIKVVLEDNIKLKLARVLVVLKNIEAIGTMALSFPPLPDLIEGNFKNEITFLFQSEEEPDNITTKIKKSGEIKTVSVEELSVDKAKSYLKQSSEREDQKSTNMGIDDSPQISSVKVNLASLDKLLEFFGELLIQSKQLEKVVEEINRRDIKELLFQMQEYMFNLQDIVLQMQLVPVSTAFRAFPRMIRGQATKENKRVLFNVNHHDVKVDRRILNDVSDIVTHLLRNSISHGIEASEERAQSEKNEEGIINLETNIQNNVLTIEISDDGKGISPDKIAEVAIEKGLYSQDQLKKMSEQDIINIIFEPNFSTQNYVNNVSGRGLGLNIVKEKVESLGGSISLETEIGAGTNFKVLLPQSRTLIKALLVKVENQIFSIALDDIERLMEISSNEIIADNRKNYAKINDSESIELLNLNRLFKLSSENAADSSNGHIKIVHIKKGNKNFGIQVDEFLKESEIVIKHIDDVKGEIPGISGAAILDDGTVSLIIDPFTINST